MAGPDGGPEKGDYAAGDASAASLLEKDFGKLIANSDTVDAFISNEITQVEAEQAQVSADIQATRQAIGCAPNSFLGTTPVLMADGASKPIDQIKAGDKIANNLPGADPGARDQAHTVTAVHVTYTDRDYTDVTVDTGHGHATITGTAHHPYWDETTRAWTDADRLHAGDQLQTTDGHAVTVLALRDFTTTAVTYNLTVDGLHTYYVVAGSTPVLVHNCDPVVGSGNAYSVAYETKIPDEMYRQISRCSLPGCEPRPPRGYR